MTRYFQFDSVEKAKMLREKGEKDIDEEQAGGRAVAARVRTARKEGTASGAGSHAVEKVVNDRAVRTASLETRKASAELLQMEAYG